MVTCAAIGCGNSSTSKSSKDVKGWHQVPSDPSRRKLWLAKMKRDPPYPKDENFNLCGLHFESSCFKRDLKVFSTFFCVCYIKISKLYVL